MRPCTALAVSLVSLSSPALAIGETVTCTAETAFDIVGPGAPKPGNSIARVGGWERFTVDTNSGSILKGNVGNTAQQIETWQVLQRGPSSSDFVAIPSGVKEPYELLVAASHNIRIRKFSEHPDYTFAVIDFGSSVIMGKCELAK